MPYIELKTNVPVSKEKADSLKSGFGKTISALGKTESWLMVNVEGDKFMYFKGNDGDFAIAEVALFGKASPSQYDNMTEKTTKVISDVLGISPDKIYIKYEEVDHWGFSGFNF